MTMSGTAKAIHDKAHQIPRCPNSADNSPKIVRAASHNGQDQTRENSELTVPSQPFGSNRRWLKRPRVQGARNFPNASMRILGVS
jgi:hypothetical protein